MHRFSRVFVAIIVIVAAVFAVQSTPVQAGLVLLPGSWTANVTYCQDGFLVDAGGTLTTSVTTIVSVIGASHPSETGTVLTFTGPGSANQSAAFAWAVPLAPGTAVTSLLDRSENGASLTGGAGRADAGVVGNCSVLPYAGPPLPPPGERNLVLIVSDTPVLDAAGGMPTGNTLTTCQTAFIIGQSDAYGKVYVMGGWIDLRHTVDVAEDYGQPNGAAIYPGCLGR